MSYRVVWFKRDLRLHDHDALAYAAQRGPVLCLYVFEPALWAQPDMALQHFNFIRESLRDLYLEARTLGLRLHVVHGEITEVLSQLHTQAPFAELVSHEETGNGWTYARDLRVASWCRAHGLGWKELPQFGVVRRLRSRDEWQSRWTQYMQAACQPVPVLQSQALPWQPAAVRDGTSYGLAAHDPPQRQRGGRQHGLQVLHEFLAQRSQQYRGGISSPLSAPTACSRLSPYLSYGCLSLREVVQATQAQMERLGPNAARQRQGLAAFISRLHWHCHFIQKLESEPAIEWHNMHRGYDGLREPQWNEAHFQALTQGRTGWPLVDACVAMLRETGWLNFRMRAMLVSVAAYPLWLHWRRVGEWLAQQFLDYEPGIHWSQLQMQSGTTGINTTRVYNPIKQAADHDPQGRFVRRWLPVLQQVPDAWLLEPWRMPPQVQSRAGVQVGTQWPIPPVDLGQATREAKARLHARRSQPQVRQEKARVLALHGSRARPTGLRPARKGSTGARAQGTLDF